MKKIKKLKQSEYLELELEHLMVDAVEKDKEIAQLKMDLAHSRMSTLKYMIKELQMEKVQLADDLQNLSKKREAQTKKRSALLDKIRKRLKLSGKFGYNPDTLEIKE